MLRFERSRDRILQSRAPVEAAKHSHPPIPTSAFSSPTAEQFVREIRERYERGAAMPLGYNYHFDFNDILFAVAWVYRNILLEHDRLGLRRGTTESFHAIARRIYDWQRDQRAEFERSIRTSGCPLTMPGPRDIIELVQMRNEEFYRDVPINTPRLVTPRLTTRASCPALLQENAQCQRRREGGGPRGLTLVQFGDLERPITPPLRRANTIAVPALRPYEPFGPLEQLHPSVSQAVNRIVERYAPPKPLVIEPHHYPPESGQRPASGSDKYTSQTPGQQTFVQRAQDDGKVGLQREWHPGRSLDQDAADPAHPQVALPSKPSYPAIGPGHFQQPFIAYPAQGIQENRHDQLVPHEGGPDAVEDSPISHYPHQQPPQGFADQRPDSNEQGRIVPQDDEEELDMYEELAAATGMSPASQFEYLRQLEVERPRALVQRIAMALDPDGRHDFLRRLAADTGDYPIAAPVTAHNQAAWPPQPGAEQSVEGQEGRRDTVGGLTNDPAPSSNLNVPKTNGHPLPNEELHVEDDVPRVPPPP